jgi:hypothetical protein
MKKLKLIAAMAILLGATAPAFSIAQIGVQGNYINDTFSSGSKASGVGLGGFARFTVGIPLLITVGGGPYVDYGTLKSDQAGAADVKQLRAGAEVVVYADVIGNLIGLTPYGRFGYGYEGNTQAVLGYDILYYGGGGHTVFGLTMKVLPMIYVFAEGGAQWSSLKPSVPSQLSAVSSQFNEITAQGWRASLGVMIWI